MPRMNTDHRRGLLVGVLNHEWTRMDTNLCSSGFPARDLLHLIHDQTPCHSCPFVVCNHSLIRVHSWFKTTGFQGASPLTPGPSPLPGARGARP